MLHVFSHCAHTYIQCNLLNTYIHTRESCILLLQHIDTRKQYIQQTTRRTAREHVSEWVCRSPFINSRRGTTSVGRHRPNQTEPARCACLVTLKPRPIALSWFKRSLTQNLNVFLRISIYARSLLLLTAIVSFVVTHWLQLFWLSLSFSFCGHISRWVF